METNLHLVFPGTCKEAFDFYEETFGTKRMTNMTFGDAPAGSPVPEEFKDLVMHTSMKLGTILLMGADTPPGREQALGGLQIAVNVTEAVEVNRLFDALSEGGSVQMPVSETFWSPLFCMLTDKFGVGWMVGIPGEQIG